jgi:anti-sigma factor RsiW
MSSDGARHCGDTLAEYAAGALTGPELAPVEAHLARCAPCRAALAGWTAVAAATVAPLEPPPSVARMVRAVVTQAALAPQARPVAMRGWGSPGSSCARSCDWCAGPCGWPPRW